MSDEKLYKIVQEMFEQRNYTNITQEEEGHVTATKPDESQVCLYPPVVKLDSAAINQIYADAKEREIFHVIIVYKDTVTPTIKNNVSNMATTNMTTEIFPATDLQFNITKHRLVPTHVLLMNEEAMEMRKKFGKNLPILLHTDPVARFYDYRKGDIIKIIEKNGYIRYRIVR